MNRLIAAAALIASSAALCPAQDSAAADDKPISDAGRRYEALARATAGPGVKDSENGWPKLLEVVAAVNRVAPSTGSGPHAGADLSVIRGGGSEGDYDKALTALKALESAGLFDKLDALRELKWIARPAQGGRVIMWMLPDLGALRQAARALAAEAHLAAAAGDWPRFSRMIENQFALARLLSQDPILITHLVSIAVASLGESQVRSLLLENKLTPEALNLIAAAMDRQLPLSPLTPALQGEQISGMDVIDMVYASEGKTPEECMALLRGVAGSPAAGEAPPEIRSREESETQLGGFYERLIKIAAQPGAPALREAEALDDEVQKQPTTVATIVLPAAVRAMQSKLRSDSYLRGTRLMLELERRRADRGQYPAALAELGAIGALADPYTDKPYGYKKLAGNTPTDGYALWSTGADGVDDGGKFEQWEPARATRPDAKGIDLVINTPDVVNRSGHGK
jgi:hypothetical protein